MVSSQKRPQAHKVPEGVNTGFPAKQKFKRLTVRNCLLWLIEKEEDAEVVLVVVVVLVAGLVDVVVVSLLNLIE